MKTRSLLLLLALAACEPTTDPAPSTTPVVGEAALTSGYALTSIGNLPGQYGGIAMAINDLGVVVGFNYGNAFWYRSGVLGQMASLPNAVDTYARSINNPGQVVGYVDTDHAQAVLWGSMNGPATPIATTLAWSQAYGINDAGIVVGTGSLSASFPGHAFRWSAATGTVDLNPAWASQSVAYAIDNTGIVTGDARVAATGATVAVRWTSTGVVTMLGTLPGGLSSNGLSIVGGRIGGDVDLGASLPRQGFLWNPATGMTPVNGFTAILGQSSHGRVVGTYMPQVGQPTLAATRLLGSISKVSILLPSLAGNFSQAYAVNSCGVIVGASVNAAGIYEPVLWRQKACDP